MSNIVVWIDDDEIVMKEIVAYIFDKLWENRIKPLIYIMGNYSTQENIDKRIQELNRVIYDKFVSYLVDNDLYMDEEIKEVESLVKEKQDNNPIADVAINKQSLLKNIHEDIMNLYNNHENSITVIENIVNEIIKSVLENNKVSNVYFAIDLCLLEDDLDRLSNKDLPILSMWLYFCFKKLEKYQVILYSSFVAPNDIVKKWKEVYIKIFGNDTNINIFNRRGESVDINDNSNKEKLKLLDIILGGKKND